jgi:hypothetical protein
MGEHPGAVNIPHGTVGVRSELHRAQASAVLDHSRAQPQGDGSCQPRSASDRDGHCEGASSRSNDYATAPLASWKGRLMRCTVHKAGVPPQRRRQGRCGPIRGQCAPDHS